MLISDLIAKLQVTQEHSGDREVFILEKAQGSDNLGQPELRKHFYKPESEDNFYVVIG